MSEKKITNRQAIAFILENCTVPDDIKEKLESIQKSFERKSSNSDKLTKTQEVNIEIMETIVDTLVKENKPLRISDMLKMPEFNEFSSQKMTSLMGKLVKRNRVTRTVEKGIAFFSVGE